MSSVVGIDLSSFALDLVKLDETTNRAEWVRCELAGKDAWERTLQVQMALYEVDKARLCETVDGFWGDVYLVAIEAPYGRGQAGTNAILNRVVGAVAASVPADLRKPERCWIVRPDEWKGGLGLKAKPTAEDVRQLAFAGGDDEWLIGKPTSEAMRSDQNARDAYCLAYWARQENAKGIAA